MAMYITFRVIRFPKQRRKASTVPPAESILHIADVEQSTKYALCGGDISRLTHTANEGALNLANCQELCPGCLARFLAQSGLQIVSIKVERKIYQELLPREEKI